LEDAWGVLALGAWAGEAHCERTLDRGSDASATPPRGGIERDPHTLGLELVLGLQRAAEAPDAPPRGFDVARAQRPADEPAQHRDLGVYALQLGGSRQRRLVLL
jgi:hypothetical protein